VVPQVNDLAMILNDTQRDIPDVMKDRHCGIVHRTELVGNAAAISKLY
jgi:hypothetical protein